MNTTTVEGLVGAGTNMNMVSIPMGVYKEARNKGDTATMERALGYASTLTAQAKEYQAKAEEGMKEDAKDVKKAEEAMRQEMVEKRKEDQKELEERIEEGKENRTDVLEISGDGEAFTQNSTGERGPVQPEAKEPVGDVIYTRTGEKASVEAAKDPAVDVVV